MDTMIIRNTEDFHNLEADWKRLQKKDPDVAFYSTFEVSKAWWEVHESNPNKNLFIVCVYHDGQIVGIAPFIIESRKILLWNWSVLKFLGKGDYFTILIDQEFVKGATILKNIFQCLFNGYYQEWDRLLLTHIKHESVLAAYLLKSELNSCFRYLTECPFIPLRSYVDFTEYIQLYQHNINNLCSRLRKEFNYKLIVITGNSICDTHLKVIAGIHIKQQEELRLKKGRIERKSIFEREVDSLFVQGLFKQCPENISLFMLQGEDGNVIAYCLGFSFQGYLYYWNTGYDPKYYRYSAGRVLIYEMTKYCFSYNNIFRVFDFGAGRYSWKFEWTSNFNLLYQLDVLNNKSRVALMLSNMQILRQIRIIIKNG